MIEELKSVLSQIVLLTQDGSFAQGELDSLVARANSIVQELDVEEVEELFNEPVEQVNKRKQSDETWEDRNARRDKERIETRERREVERLRLKKEREERQKQERILPPPSLPAVLSINDNSQVIDVTPERVEDRLDALKEENKQMGWSGRIWVGGKRYYFDDFAGKTTIAVTIVRGSYSVQLSTDISVFEADFPADTEYYNIAQTVGDIHCDRF